MRTACLLAALVLSAMACRPDIDDRTSRVDRLRVLAVRAEPAEAAPGAPVKLSVLVAGPEGPRGDLVADFAFCRDRRGLAEASPASASCLDDTGIVALGASAGAPVTGTVPGNACGLFGPERSAGATGEPSGRPADPDATGGYYQPGRIRVPGTDLALFEVRTRCGLPGATLEATADYGRRYRPNANPALSLTAAGTPHADAAIVAVRAGEALPVTASWPACTSAPCDGAEPYVAFDLASRTVVDRRESMLVSWFATQGSWDVDRTGRTEADAERDSSNTWRAPSTPGSVHLWVVLRDARGGTDVHTVRVDVR
ncbi:MAG: hypothetical protein HOO96_19920 [Polyangiaceae bacterium]|nr:hypothetical protein [Polyangiaceae bacterium]